MSALTIGPETWPWDPVDWWRSLHDRVSRVLACMTSPRAKLESDRYWWSLVLDIGTLERPWPTTKSMCSKAEWFPSPKLGGQGSGAPPPSSILPVARAGNAELDRYPYVANAGGWRRAPYARPRLHTQHLLTLCTSRGLSVDHQPNKW